MESPTGETVIPVLEEVAEFGTRVDQTSTVRLRKIVHATTNSEKLVRLANESVRVERFAKNEVLLEPRQVEQRGDTLVVPVHEERWIKQLVLVEELHVSRHRSEHDQPQDVPLRREEFVVERLDPAIGKWVEEPRQ